MMRRVPCHCATAAGRIYFPTWNKLTLQKIWKLLSIKKIKGAVTFSGMTFGRKICQVRTKKNIRHACLSTKCHSTICHSGVFHCTMWHPGVCHCTIRHSGVYRTTNKCNSKVCQATRFLVFENLVHIILICYFRSVTIVYIILICVILTYNSDLCHSATCHSSVWHSTMSHST